MKTYDEMSFEEAIIQLEALVENMESGQLPIDKAMQSFEKGVALVRRCEELLNGYEQKITTLKKIGGEVIETSFILNGDNNND